VLNCCPSFVVHVTDVDETCAFATRPRLTWLVKSVNEAWFDFVWMNRLLISTTTRTAPTI
jgi:hypothetical protein